MPPYKSLAQEKWAHTPVGMKALGGQKKVDEWDQATEGMKLPDHVRNTKINKMIKRGKRK